jgi:hypothetical protein
MNQPPEAPLDRLEKLLKGIDFFLFELTQDVNSEQLLSRVQEVRQKITDVLKPIEEKRKRAYEAAYGQGTWQPKPLDQQEKLALIRLFKTTLENFEKKILSGN